MKTLVIEREAVKNNIGVIKERAGEAVIYAVLTGNCQGAGLVELARLLREEGIGRFAVSEPAEAAALRRAGCVEEEILMLRPTVDRAELEQLIDLNVVCTVGSADTGMALNGAAEARSTVVEAHIQIDTGMGFGGFLADEPEKILSVYRNLPNVAVSGICTQLHARKKGGEDLAARLGQFHRVVEAIRAAGFETGVVHAAGSYALLHCADARLDGVRAGSALLGRCRRVHGDGLYRVGYGEVGIEETRWLPKGHTVGSARPVVLRRPTRVAVLPVGYQNGFGVARAQGGGLGALLRRWLAASWGPSAPLRPWWTSPTSSAPPAIRRCSTSTPCTHGGLCGSTGSPAARRRPVRRAQGRVPTPARRTDAGRRGRPGGAGSCNKQREGNLSDARSCYQSEECLRHH